MKSIDKSSGRKCAYSMAARVLAGKLVEDGILNKPIARKPRKNDTDILFIFNSSAYFIHVGEKWLSERPDNEPLWTPSFIEHEIWEKAAKAFQPRHDLRFNVETHLFPEMKDYIRSLTDEDLVALIRDYLLESDILNCPIRQSGGNTFFFDDAETYTMDKGSTRFPYERRVKFHLFQVKDFASFNMNVWVKAVTNFNPGMTLTDCARVFLETDLEPKSAAQLPYIDQLIQQIHSPEFERVPENMNTGTFDRIRVLVGLPRFMFQTWDDLRTAVRENRRKIDQRVIQKIESDRQFRRYHIPLNFLTLSEVLLRKDYSLEYIFELRGNEVRMLTKGASDR